jgi:hypothetical protein
LTEVAISSKWCGMGDYSTTFLGLLLAYFFAKMLVVSWMMQKALQKEIAPAFFRNPNFEFLLILLPTILFLLLVILAVLHDGIAWYYSIPALVVLSSFFSWSGKMRAMGVYKMYLQKELDLLHDSANDLGEIMRERKEYLQRELHLLNETPKELFERAKAKKTWRD